MELKNRWVHFKICDVYLPDPRQLLVELHGDDVLEGRVILTSRTAAGKPRYSPWSRWLGSGSGSSYRCSGSWMPCS